MASAREKRPGVWEMRQSLGRDPLTGKARYASRTVHTTSKRALARALAAFEVEVGAKGRAVVPKEAATVSQLLERYLEHISEGKTIEELAAGTDRASASPKTIDDYQGWARRDIVPQLGHFRLAKLTTYDLDMLYDGIIRSGRRTTARKVHNLLHAALAQAVRWGWVESNPADRVKVPHVRKADTPATPPAVVRLLIATMEQTDPELATWLFVSADAGTRRGEVAGLHWFDVDWSAGTVLVRCAVGVTPSTGTYEKDTKTHAERLVPLSAGTMEVLRRHRRQMEDRAAAAGGALSPTAYVFSPSIDGSKPWNPSTVSSAFCRVRKRAGVEGVRLADLRHFVGTQLEAAGRPLSEIADRLGHSEISTTSDIYVKRRATGGRAAADMMGALLVGRDEGGQGASPKLTPAPLDAPVSGT